MIRSEEGGTNMTSFDPTKLSVTMIPPTTSSHPLENRKYTLTHSDETGQLYLGISHYFDISSIDPKLRDEVLAEWTRENGQYLLKAKVHISHGEFNEISSKERFLIFQKELPLALTAIINGDQTFYSYYPWLLDAPIQISFESIYPELNQISYWGTPRQYLKDYNINRSKLYNS